MTRMQAETIAEHSGGTAHQSGDEWFVELWITEGIAVSFRGGFGERSLGLCADTYTPINTSIAHSIELAVAKIEHAEELCIAAGLGDPRSKE